MNSSEKLRRMSGWREHTPGREILVSWDGTLAAAVDLMETFMMISVLATI